MITTDYFLVLKFFISHDSIVIEAKEAKITKQIYGLFLLQVWFSTNTMKNVLIEFSLNNY